VRIPKRVNDAWDWAERHSRGLTVTVVLIVVCGAAFLLPAAATLVLGAAVGGALVYNRMSRRQRRLRAEIDELLRENGALRHERTVLASGVIAAETQTTEKIMIIPAELEESESETQTTRRLPVLPDE
jgi:hypothetical protein